jgi:hypothetical protein
VTHGDKRLRGGPLFDASQMSDLICLRLAVVMAIIIDYMKACGEPNAVFTCATRVANATRAATCGRLYSCDALLEGLAQHLQDMAAEFREFIQKENPMVCQRHVA